MNLTKDINFSAFFSIQCLKKQLCNITMCESRIHKRDCSGSIFIKKTSNLPRKLDLKFNSKPQKFDFKAFEEVKENICKQIEHLSMCGS